MPSYQQPLDTIARGEPQARKKKYRTRVLYVAPEEQRETFKQHGRCFLGISLENSQFTRAKFASMVEWVSRRFQECTLLVGDSMHRITLETTRKMPLCQAREHALRLGTEFIENEGTAVDAFRDACKFSFLRCSSIVETDLFATHYQMIRGFFDTNDKFRESVESFGKTYHRKHWESLSEAEREYRIQRSCDYFLEEFAIFTVLREQGIRVFAYPGSFSTLNEVANGEHDGVDPMLRDLTIVSLSLRKR